MPRDYTHWIVAVETADSKEIGESIFKAAKENPGLLIKGAVFPDVLYYLKKGSCYIVNVGDRLHGPRTEDTYDILRALLRKLIDILKNIRQNQGNEESKRKEEKKRDYLLAFIVGVVTHIFSDVTFHPMVYHLTGDYYSCVSSTQDKAMIRHRTLECIFDLYFSDGFKRLFQYDEALKEWQEEYEFIFDDLNLVFRCTDKPPRSIFRDAYRDLSGVREFIMKHKFLCKLLHRVDFLLPASLKKKVAVCYSETQLRYIPEYSDTIAYRNPVTGEDSNMSLNDLKKKAVDASIDFCVNHLAKYIEKEESNIAGRGPSLDTGIVNGSVDNMVYFNIAKF